MAAAWIWAAAGLALMGIELLAPGVFMLWIGIAALAAGAATGLFGLALEAQLAVFSVAALATCVAGYLIYRNSGKTPRGRELVNDPHAIIGSTGEVAEPLRHGRGRVRIGDTLWLAEGPDLPVGSAVRVKSLSGTTLKVEALPG